MAAPKDCKDITNIKLGNLMSLEFLLMMGGFIVSATLVWGSLNAQVQANADNDTIIIATQTSFADSIEEIKVNQEVARVEIEHVKEQLKEQTDNSKYVKSQVDDIKRILMEYAASR